jgi:hypothetical protein
MLIIVASLAKNFGRWYVLNVPIDHPLDPCCLLFPGDRFCIRSANLDDLGHSYLTMMNME